MDQLINICGLMVPIRRTPCGEIASRRTKYTPKKPPQCSPYLIRLKRATPPKF